MSNVKNYDVGQIRLDLPTPNYIHELPLFSFGDVHGSVNLSLVFNYGMKAENSNPFNLSAGYKLNLHKRLIIENSVPIKYQDESGKCTELISTGGVYALDDDSFRILRATENSYTVENSDYSREEYDLEGNLIAVYDKYSTLILEYVYLNNRLRCIHYRGELRISLQYDTNNRIKRITCQDRTINLAPIESGWQIVHFSGVTYNLMSAHEMDYIATAISTEDSAIVSYSTVLSKIDWKTLCLSNCIGAESIDTMTYKFPNDDNLCYKTKYSWVEIIDKRGVASRVQYQDSTPLYSYEVFPDAEQFRTDCNTENTEKFVGDVNIYSTLDKTGYGNTIGKLRWGDSTPLSRESESAKTWRYSVSQNSFDTIHGYYLLTGWVKQANSLESATDANIKILEESTQTIRTIKVEGVSNGQWVFFAYMFKINANIIKISAVCQDAFELKDVRIAVKPMYFKTYNGYCAAISESILLFKGEATKKDEPTEEERTEEETREPETEEPNPDESEPNEEEPIEQERTEEETREPEIDEPEADGSQPNEDEPVEEEETEEETSEPESDDILLTEDEYCDELGYAYIPIENAIFSCNCDWNSSVYGRVYYQDLLRYKLNQYKGVHLNEFYCNMGKTILVTDSSCEIIVTYNDKSYKLNDCWLANTHYTPTTNNDGSFSSQGRFVRKLDVSSGLLVESVLDYEYNVLTSQTFNNDLDIIKMEYEGIVSTCERNKDLVLSECVEGLYSRTTSYSTDSNGDQIITVVDEFNNTTVYTIDSVWGVVKNIRMPDGSMVVDEFDDDRCAKLKRSFHGQDIRSNEFAYLKGNLSEVKTGGLTYQFYYDKGSLSGVTKNAQWVEQHHSENEQLDSYYPSQRDQVYANSVTWDKYGRLVAVNGELTNIYSYDPYFDENAGELDDAWDNANARLVMTQDHRTNQISRYEYTEQFGNGTPVDKGRLTRVLIAQADDFSKEISDEQFCYDDGNRLTSYTHTYDVANHKSVGGAIIYTEKADAVEDYIYKLDDETVVKTQNGIDSFKRVSEKQVTMNDSVFSKKYIYDKTRVKRLEETAFNKNLGKNRYYYDSMGRIKSVVYSSADGTDDYKTYEYDQFGQLIKENNEALDKTIVYQYNEVGNIVNVKEYAFCMCSAPKGEYTETTYSYSGTRPDIMTNFNGHSIKYNDDSIWYPEKYNGKLYTWEKGKLVGIKTDTEDQTGTQYEECTFAYNAYGQRISKNYTVQQGADSEDWSYTYNIEYNYDYSGRLIREFRVQTTDVGSTFTRELTYLYDENGMIGFVYSFDGSGARTYYYHRNLQGDVIAIYDTNGTKQAEYAYDAFGNCTVLYSGVYDIANNNPIRYRGYYYDQETGLYYLNARYYNPEWRRFISPDDTTYLDPESVNGLNQYAYCRNDPVNYKSILSLGGTQVTSASSLERMHVGTSGSFIGALSISGSGCVGRLVSGLSSAHGVVDKVSSYLVGSLDGLLNYAGIAKFNGLQLKLSNYSNWLLGIGIGLDIAVSAYDSFNNSNLTTGQKWASFGADVGYIGVTSALSYGAGALVTKGSVALGTTVAGYALGATIGGVTIGFAGAMAIGAAVVVIGIVAGTVLIAVASNALDNWWDKQKEVWFS